MAALTTAQVDPFHANLRADLEADLAQLKENLCNNMATSIENYRYMCGTIVALQQVLVRCTEIEMRMYGAKEKQSESE